MRDIENGKSGIGNLKNIIQQIGVKFKNTKQFQIDNKKLAGYQK